MYVRAYTVGGEAIDKFVGAGQSTDTEENNSQGEQSNTPLIHYKFCSHVPTHVQFERRHRFSDDEDSD